MFISDDICVWLTSLSMTVSMFIHVAKQTMLFYSFYDQVKFFSYAKSTHFKKRNGRPLSFIEATHHFKQCKSFAWKEKSFPTLANILSIVKHFSVKVRLFAWSKGSTKSGGMNSYFILVLFLSFPVNSSVWNADGKCYFVLLAGSSVVLILSEWYGKQYAYLECGIV